MAGAFIALGGNVGDVRTALSQAISQLCEGSHVTLKARSSDYQTPPWGVTEQPPFINACIEVDTRLSPRGLLDRIHEVERAFGRDRHREERWGPRTVDIDILTYDNVTMDEERLTLPHPRLFERAFVLVPLVEIAPDLVISGVPVRAACERVDMSAITKLP
jgi:2-amino-4-hydroxy-6-hydroxymethyldihydropteridine diphosphokinase